MQSQPAGSQQRSSTAATTTHRHRHTRARLFDFAVSWAEAVVVEVAKRRKGKGVSNGCDCRLVPSVSIELCTPPVTVCHRKRAHTSTTLCAVPVSRQFIKKTCMRIPSCAGTGKSLQWRRRCSTSVATNSSRSGSHVQTHVNTRRRGGKSPYNGRTNEHKQIGVL